METEGIKERIKLLRKGKKLTQEEFGKRIGLSDVAISLIESGKNAVTETVFKLICLIFGVREEWLRYGKGSQCNEKEGTELEILLSIYRALSQSGKREVCEFAEFRLQKEEQTGMPPAFPLEPIPPDDGGFEEDRNTG
jgi:transcriptional regulator with XRE-family HTH domain